MPTAGDPRPQAGIRTYSGPNATEPTGPYVDKALTTRNVDNGVVPDTFPARTSAKDLGNGRRFYAEDRVSEIDQTAAAAENADVAPPPNSGNSWKIADDAQGFPRSNDFYGNGGLHGKNYLKHADDQV